MKTVGNQVEAKGSALDRRGFLSLGAALALTGCSSFDMEKRKPENPAFEAAMKALAATTPFDDEARAPHLHYLQDEIERIGDGKIYDEFVARGLTIGEGELIDIYTRYPAFEWYDRAFDKVLEEVKATRVTGNRPAVWYVYNMGVVVKTPTETFSIDLCHRKAELLAPHLDFALITHNHADHYTPEFVRAMRRLKKPVRSNFILDWDNYTHASVSEKTYGSVTVRATSGDHNVHLPDAVLCYECTIGSGPEAYVLYHSGDCCRADHLRPLAPQPDLYLGHCAIGLDFRKAYHTSMPAKVIMPIHHQELGHLGGPWRCVGFFEEPAEIVRQLREDGAKAAMPVWGDRIEGASR